VCNILWGVIEMNADKDESKALDKVSDSAWGELPKDNFGYTSDDERRAKRGLEDWELVEKIPESQRGIPKWFLGVVVAVLLVAIGLSFPFWGNRPGHEREWINWGFGVAIAYLLVFGTFVYYMVNMYGSHAAGRLDSDHTQDDAGKADPTAAENEHEKP
jgi:hypothetical protein